MPALEKVLTGLTGLDEVLAGGLPRGRPTLVCGAPGCGKTLFGTQFLVRGALDHGKSGVFIAFEARPQDLALNVASRAFELADLGRRKLLAIDHIRIEPHGITAFMTCLTPSEAALERAQLAISSAVDTWILVNSFEPNGERNRDLRVLESRGTAHSNQARDFVITSRVELIDVCVDAVASSTARDHHESRDEESLLREQEIEQTRRSLERRKALHHAQLAKLQGVFESDVGELQRSLSALKKRACEQTPLDRVTMTRRRQADTSSVDHASGGKP